METPIKGRKKVLLGPSDDLKSATHWRLRGEEVRTLADDAHDPYTKAVLLRIAEDYDRLAKQVDDRAAFKSKIAAVHHHTNAPQGRKL